MLRWSGSARSATACACSPSASTQKATRAPPCARYIAERHLVTQFRYLLGTPAELRTVWAAWHVLAVRSSPDVVDHVAYTALIDPTGRERVLYDSSVKYRQVLHDLRVLMSA